MFLLGFSCLQLQDFGAFYFYKVVFNILQDVIQPADAYAYDSFLGIKCFKVFFRDEDVREANAARIYSPYCYTNAKTG